MSHSFLRPLLPNLTILTRNKEKAFGQLTLNNKDEDEVLKGNKKRKYLYTIVIIVGSKLHGIVCFAVNCICYVQFCIKWTISGLFFLYIWLLMHLRGYKMFCWQQNSISVEPYNWYIRENYVSWKIVFLTFSSDETFKFLHKAITF